MNTTTVNPLYEVYYNLQVTDSVTHVLNQSNYFAVLLSSPFCWHSLLFTFYPGRYSFFPVCQVLHMYLTTRGEYSCDYEVFVGETDFLVLFLAMTRSVTIHSLRISLHLRWILLWNSLVYYCSRFSIENTVTLGSYTFEYASSDGADSASLLLVGCYSFFWPVFLIVCASIILLIIVIIAIVFIRSYSKRDQSTSSVCLYLLVSYLVSYCSNT